MPAPPLQPGSGGTPHPALLEAGLQLLCQRLRLDEHAVQRGTPLLRLCRQALLLGRS